MLKNERKKPQVFMDHIIKIKGKEIGYIRLVNYFHGNGTPHIEYFLEEKYHRQGIMTQELTKYFKWCKKYDFYQFVAVVEDGNEASEKLLKKFNFFKTKNIDGSVVFVSDRRVDFDALEKYFDQFK